VHRITNNHSTIQQFNQSTTQLSPTTDLHRKNEKGKRKKEKGEWEKGVGASILPDESGPLCNRLLPAGLQTATIKMPPFEGGYGG